MLPEHSEGFSRTGFSGSSAHLLTVVPCLGPLALSDGSSTPAPPVTCSVPGTQIRSPKPQACLTSGRPPGWPGHTEGKASSSLQPHSSRPPLGSILGGPSSLWDLRLGAVEVALGPWLHDSLRGTLPWVTVLSLCLCPTRAPGLAQECRGERGCEGQERPCPGWVGASQSLSEGPEPGRPLPFWVSPEQISKARCSLGAQQGEHIGRIPEGQRDTGSPAVASRSWGGKHPESTPRGRWEAARAPSPKEPRPTVSRHAVWGGKRQPVSGPLSPRSPTVPRLWWSRASPWLRADSGRCPHPHWLPGCLERGEHLSHLWPGTESTRAFATSWGPSLGRGPCVLLTMWACAHPG